MLTRELVQALLLLAAAGLVVIAAIAANAHSRARQKAAQRGAPCPSYSRFYWLYLLRALQVVLPVVVVVAAQIWLRTLAPSQWLLVGLVLLLVVAAIWAYETRSGIRSGRSAARRAVSRRKS